MAIVVKGGPVDDFGDMGPEFTKEMAETSLQAEALNKATQLSGGDKKRKSKSKKNAKKRNLKKNTKKRKITKGKSKRKSKRKY